MNVVSFSSSFSRGTGYVCISCRAGRRQWARASLATYAKNVTELQTPRARVREFTSTSQRQKTLQDQFGSSKRASASIPPRPPQPQQSQSSQRSQSSQPPAEKQSGLPRRRPSSVSASRSSPLPPSRPSKLTRPSQKYRFESAETAQQSQKSRPRPRFREARGNSTNAGTESATEPQPDPENANSKSVHGEIVETTALSSSILDIDATLQKIQDDVTAIIASDTEIPSEKQIKAILEEAQTLVNPILDHAEMGETAEEHEISGLTGTGSSFTSPMISSPMSPSPSEALSSSSSTTLLPSSTSSSLAPTSFSYEDLSSTLCRTLYSLLKDPKVYISLSSLSRYNHIVCSLLLPEYLPEIYHLYANKPVASASSTGLKFRKTWYWSPRNAVPQRLSRRALHCAMDVRDLGLCVAIIDTTVATSAYRLHTAFRKGGIPWTVAIVGPWTGAFAAADWMSKHQVTMEPQAMWWTCIAGAAGFIGTYTTIGWVAVTTWNDHHKRMRWVKGTPLRYRFVREEEREYFDLVAQSWGYEDKNRWGEESGEEWESLKETVGPRWLMLDQPELLPGML